MIIRNILLVILVSSPFCLFGQNIDLVSSEEIIRKSERLKELYVKSISEEDKDEYRLLFFNEFPNTFKEFHKLYGYGVAAGDFSYDSLSFPRPLYRDSYDHISTFFDLDSVLEKDVFCGKLIRLSMGGVWDADAVNYLKHSIQNILP